jgi:hypothetical protein
MAQSDFAQSDDKQINNDHLTVHPKIWHGKQDECDLCHISFMDIPWFADAQCRFAHRRQWAIVCPHCHAQRTSGKFGISIGQKYDAKTKIKLEG